MATIIIEELNRNHKLLGRHKFETASVGIGRGYHNDIILNDPHVCAEHLSIHFDGDNWTIQDLNSVNGSYLGDSKKNAHQHIVCSGDIIRIGNSQIRLIFLDHPVDESVVLSRFEELINFAKQPIVIISAILIFSLLNGYLIYLSMAKEVQTAQLIAPTIKSVLIFALWPLGVALVSHLSKNEARIWPQIGISFIVFNIFWLSDISETILMFNTASNALTSIYAFVIPAIIGFILFWLNIYIGFDMSPKRRNTVACGLVVLFFGGGALLQYSKTPDFNPNPIYNSVIMPPDYLYVKGSSTEDFVADIEQVMNDTSKLAKQK